jgi:DNA-binding response OmpR family regulator
MRLLLVDDDEVLRCIVGESLTDNGHEVDLAVDGIEALQQLARRSYDAVICDWEMPRMDGPTLCRTVRSGPLGREPYFIMLTGKDSPVAEADGFDSGVDAYLAKPCEPTDLLAALRTAQSIGAIPKAA